MLTFIIIGITALVSFMAFNNRELTNKLIFYPPAVKDGQWQRFFTYGVIHADWNHLIFNMFSLYFFGPTIERIFKESLGFGLGSGIYILLYVSSLFVSIFPTYTKNKDNQSYFGLGASGAVSAVVFAFILINPMSFMGIMFIPLYLPAFLFGIIYVLISVYLEKNHSGRINHNAHVTGGIYGIIFTFVVFLILAKINLFTEFIRQIQISSWRDLIHFGY